MTESFYRKKGDFKAKCAPFQCAEILMGYTLGHAYYKLSSFAGISVARAAACALSWV